MGSGVGRDSRFVHRTWLNEYDPDTEGSDFGKGLAAAGVEGLTGPNGHAAKAAWGRSGAVNLAPLQPGAWPNGLAEPVFPFFGLHWLRPCLSGPRPVTGASPSCHGRQFL